MRKKIVIGILVLFMLFLGVIWSASGGFKGTPLADHPTYLEPVIVQKGQSQKDSYTYSGKDGETAMNLLIMREKAWVGADESGLVVSINHRKADPKKREFWAFYVNGKMAQVGPKEYVTQNNDTIEWKIEKY